MKILSFNSYQAQNQKKQNINFESVTMSKRTYKWVDRFFIHKFEPVEGGGWSVSEKEIKKFRDLYTIPEERVIASNIDCDPQAHPGESVGGYFDSIKKKAQNYTIHAMKKAMRRGKFDEMFPELSGKFILSTNEGANKNKQSFFIRMIEWILDRHIENIGIYDLENPGSRFANLEYSNPYRTSKAGWAEND